MNSALTPKLESDSEKLENQRQERDSFRKDLDRLIELERDYVNNTDMLGFTQRQKDEPGQEKYKDLAERTAEEMKTLMYNTGEKYAVIFPGLAERIQLGKIDEVFKLINPPPVVEIVNGREIKKEQPLKMNWYPEKLEKK